MKNVTMGRFGGFMEMSSWSVLVQDLVVYNKRNTTDAGLKPSSMTLSHNGKKTMHRFGGFTLIELLVVVLIIGILAAVALPQYNKAVDKSRVSTMISLLRPLAEAKKSYYMATGTHARTFDDLDFSIPSSCSVSEDSIYGQTASCGKAVLLLDPWISHSVAGRMRLSDSSEITLAYPVTADRKKECLACPSGSNAEVVCKNLYPNVTAREFGDKEKCSGFYL